MKIVTLQHDGTQPKVLTQSDLAYSDATYVVCSKYKIVGSVRFPNGSQLWIEGGSICGGWLEFPCAGQSIHTTDWYSYLTLASRATMKIENGVIKYEDSGDEYLTDGCFVNTTDSSFEMFLNASCRIMLPSGTSKGSIHVISDKGNPIQIDGKSDFTMCAQNCRLERIFENSAGWTLINRIEGAIRYNIFENCEIFAEDYPLSKTAKGIGSDFFTVNVNDLPGDSKDELNATETINWFVAKQCVFNNIGIAGGRCLLRTVLSCLERM